MLEKKAVKRFDDIHFEREKHEVREGVVCYCCVDGSRLGLL